MGLTEGVDMDTLVTIILADALICLSQSSLLPAGIIGVFVTLAAGERRRLWVPELPNGPHGTIGIGIGKGV
jgi:hypothetical protein